ncbi:MAG: hypothetical protein JWL69_3070 [Phycisphaerales bacterium]|nr:hypothetical protein [Phycisphaerales bacterium]MDB5354248.1 hypothetical protein [Phycisphaerales bacterium]
MMRRLLTLPSPLALARPSDPVAFAAGCVFVALAIPFLILDWRKVERGNYRKKYGPKSSSVWILPAMAFLFLAMLCFDAAFTRL